MLEEALCGPKPLPKLAAWRLVQELYATEFKTFKSSHNSLDEAFAATPEKQGNMLEHMLNVLKKQIDKELLGLTFVQELVWQYFRFAEPEVCDEAATAALACALPPDSPPPLRSGVHGVGALRLRRHTGHVEL